MSRTATVTRKTRETNITVILDLDGSGKADLHRGCALSRADATA